MISKFKVLYWFLLNRKRYKNHVRFSNIIKHGRCHFRAPCADLNFTYYYFCMDLIDKGWKKENVTIQNSSELVRTE